MMKKRLSRTSQYVRDLSVLPTGEWIWQSQMGQGYALAELGNLDELLDRLKKYDVLDEPLDVIIARKAINKFTSHIVTCSFVPEEDAFSDLNFAASVGHGARAAGVISRDDPALVGYLHEYLNLASVGPIHALISASQKDEMRAFDENGVLKTPRLFMSYPVEQTFLSAIVLGDFLRQVYLSSFMKDGGVSAVGDPVQSGALAYYKTMMDARPYKYCTDTSGQDASVPGEFINLVYDEIKKFYSLSEEDDAWFENVRYNSVNKLLNVNGFLYRCSRGLASGDYLTIVINMMWRLYLAYMSYNHDLERYHDENTVVICGDDFAQSSNYPDLNHDSKFARITWAGHPVGWEDMDFCSCRFHPNIHHDPAKVLSVLYGRRRASQLGSPGAEMQRLGGLLLVHSNEDVHQQITRRMEMLRDKHGLVEEFDALWKSYREVYEMYNSWTVYN